MGSLSRLQGIIIMNTKAKPKVAIFTDGACRGNPGPGGWAALLRYADTEKQLSGAQHNTTNNRMELLAAIKALQALKRSCEVDLTTDSQYLQKGVTEWLANWKQRNWRTANKKPVKNIDLWQQLDALIVKHTITWYWVRGHSGHVENELVDRLANIAIDNMEKD